MTDLDLKAIKCLSGSVDYRMWKFQVGILLTSMGLQQHMEGHAARDDNWRVNDAKIMRIITLTVARPILARLVHCITSSEMFHELDTFFRADTDFQVMSRYVRLLDYNFDPNERGAANLARLQNIAAELERFGVHLDNRLLIAKFLIMLPERYYNLDTAWQALPLKERSLSRLSQLVTKLEESLTSAETQPLAAGREIISHRTADKNDRKPPEPALKMIPVVTEINSPTLRASRRKNRTKKNSTSVARVNFLSYDITQHPRN